MSTRSAIGVVVLAAGAARRYGASKLDLPLGGIPIVRRAAQSALALGDQVVVVTGAHHELLATLLEGLNVSVARNPSWQRGKGSSIAHGMRALRELSPGCAAAIVMLADQVFVGTPELRRLIEGHDLVSHGISAARYRGILGAPCCFAQRYFAELAALDGADGAQIVLQRHATEVRAVAMPEAEADVDTPADYAAAQRQLG